MFKESIIPKILIILFTLLFNITACFAGTDKVILAFGDSITVGLWENDIIYGYGVRDGGYEPDVEALTDQRNNHYDVLNYGHAGEKTIWQSSDKGGYYRLIQDVLPKHPDARYVLILEGTNDYWTGTAQSTTVQILGWMVDACRDMGIEPILATLTPDTTSSWGAQKNIPGYNDLIVSLSNQKNVKLVDLYTAMVDEWDSKYAYGEDYGGGLGYIDNLHLSRDGYSKMAELWMEILDIPFLGGITPWLNLLLKD